jgi:hypothetical protein
VRRRRLRLALVGLGAVVALAGAALAGSALTDLPAKSAYSEIVITAPRERVWQILTDLDAYPEWNPVVTRAAGTLEEGESLEVQLLEPGGGPEATDLSVLVVHPMRKIRWQDRMFVPGIRDREYEIIVAPAGDGRYRVVQRERVEGLGAPFVDIDGIDEGLDLIAHALKRRAESTEALG